MAASPSPSASSNLPAAALPPDNHVVLSAAPQDAPAEGISEG